MSLVFASARMSPPLQLSEVGRLLHDGYWKLDLKLE
jgi:hypothetical protein